MTVDEVREMLSEWKDMDNRMAIVFKETGELIGSVGYWGTRKRGRRSAPSTTIWIPEPGTGALLWKRRRKSYGILRKTCM